jgi:protein-S-isoprenylcysteine O-methyltransferase Ste14
MPSHGGKITAFLGFQFIVVVILLAVILFRPGEWTAARWTGVAIALPATVLLFVARYQIGRSFSVTPQARELVTHGIYSKIRNPIYVFSGLLVAGLALALEPWALLLLIILVPVQILRARREARVLQEKFGDEYRAYREKTWF